MNKDKQAIIKRIDQNIKKLERLKTYISQDDTKGLMEVVEDEDFRRLGSYVDLTLSSYINKYMEGKNMGIHTGKNKYNIGPAHRVHTHNRMYVLGKNTGYVQGAIMLWEFLTLNKNNEYTLNGESLLVGYDNYAIKTEDFDFDDFELIPEEELESWGLELPNADFKLLPVEVVGIPNVEVIESMR